MLGLYRKKDVQQLVKELRKEYHESIKEQLAVQKKLKEENRTLKARVLELEGERAHVSDAIVRAVAEGEKIRKEAEVAAGAERKELTLLREKCRLLSDDLLKKYPDAEDVRAFSAFLDTLGETVGEEGAGGFDMDEVLYPKEPLDLGKLCKDLGLMEENE